MECSRDAKICFLHFDDEDEDNDLDYDDVDGDSTIDYSGAVTENLLGVFTYVCNGKGMCEISN